MKKLFILGLTWCLSLTTLHAQTWLHLGGAVDAFSVGEVFSIAVDHSGNIYAAGGFYDFNGHYFVAQWNGTSWTELGTGSHALQNANPVESIAVDGSGNVYATVYASTVPHYYVAKWNGTSWSQLGTGPNALNANNDVLFVTTDAAGNVYATGDFTNGASFTEGSKYVAKWNGTSWSELGTGSNALNAYEEGNINQIVIDNDGNVYAAGDFMDENYKSYVAKWNGTSWSELGTGANALNSGAGIYSIAVDGSGNVYAVTYNTSYPSSSHYYVAKWNGTTWSQLGSGSHALNTNYVIREIVVDAAGNVYAAGQFQNADGVVYVAKWDGTDWSEYGTGSDSNNDDVLENYTIDALTLDASGNVYACFFTNDEEYVVEQCAGSAGTTAVTNAFCTADLKVYPNPVNGLVNMTLPEDGEVKVYDFSGTLISTHTGYTGHSSFELGNVPAGVYSLVFNGQKTSYAPVKVVKE